VAASVENPGVGRLRIGIVGCGEATQIMHLPSLAFRSDLFEVTALCDVSASVVGAVADRWRIGARTTAHEELLRQDDVDAVLVAVPDAFHGAVTLDALAAGKHVLVEKPMCMTLREADEIEAASAESERIVQVGYVRRYAGATARAKELLPELGPVRFARAHDILGLNPLIVEQTTDVARADDVAPDRIDAARALRDELVREAIGDASHEIADAYRLLLSLGSHDASLLRDLVGPPGRVLYAATRHDAWYVSGAFDYGTFVCHFEIGFDRIPRVDTHLELYGEEKVLRLEFPSPFVRHLPVRLSLTSASGEGVRRETLQPSWGDAFIGEWEAFHAAVTEGAPVRTPPADARQDLELFAEMARLMPLARGASEG
jgi:predicted dehydrogenase